MPAHIAYRINFSGDVDQATLEQLRAGFGLERKGRLTDAEDALFGYREEPLEGSATTLEFALWRSGPTSWRLTIHYLGDPPARSTIERYRPHLRATIDRAGLHVGAEGYAL